MAKIQSFIDFFKWISILQYVSCALVIKPIRLNYNIQPCQMLSQQDLASDLEGRSGWKLSSLLGDQNTSFKTISFGLWYYYYQQEDGLQYQIGISTGFDSVDLSIENNLIGFWHDGSKKNLQFEVNLGTQASQVKEFSSFTDSYKKQWRSAMIIFYSSNGQGHLQITDALFQNNYILSVNVGGVDDLLESYPEAFLNVDYSVGSQLHYNSCSRQKDIFFHYSIDEEYSLDYIYQLQFKTSTQPLFYFDFKQYENSDQVINYSPKKKLINLKSIGKNEAQNGDQEGNGQLQIQLDQQFNYYSYFFSQNSIIILPENESADAIIISCYIQYDFQSSNIQDQIKLFSSDNQNLIISMIQKQSNLYLNVQIDGLNDETIKFGPTNSRHTFQILAVGNNLQKTQIKYYVDDQLLGNILINSQLILSQYFQIGSTQNDQSLDSLSLSIQDFIFFTNSHLFQPGDIDQIDQSLIMQNCNLFVSSSLDTAYCLVCIQDYTFDTNGVCNQNEQINPKSPRPQIKNLIQASKQESFISISADTSQNNIQFEINQNGISDFLVVGYFKLTSLSSALKKIPLITVSVEGEWYNFLNLYLNSDKILEMKQIFDYLNDVQTLKQQLPFSIIDRWIIFGLGYQMNSKSSYAIYQDVYSNQIQKIQILSQYQLDSRITQLSVCVGCYIQGSLYSPFLGLVSSLKVIYSPELQNLKQFQLIFEGNSDLGLTNPDFQNVLSLKDIYTFNYDADLLIDCSQNYFFQGICINPINCSELGGKNNQFGQNNFLFDDQSQKACNQCDSNCAKCNTQHVCQICIIGYYLDLNSQCQPCSSQQYYDTVLKKCVAICSVGYLADKINQICIQNYDIQQYGILPKFQQNYFLYSEGFYLIDSSRILLQSQYTICFIDSPYQGYSFFGSATIEIGTSIYMQWESFPAHYKKEVNFYVTLFNSQTVSDLKVLINEIEASLVKSKLITPSLNKCTKNDSQLSIYQVYFELLNTDSNFYITIQTLGKGFAVRNVIASVQKCHNTCVSCLNGPSQSDCIECSLENSNRINNQCLCLQNQYSSFTNCFSPPCFQCLPCKLDNCLQCEDFTGYCLKCQIGFVVQDGKCQKACNQLYSVDTTKPNQICVKTQDLIMSNFINGRVVQYLDFWNLSFNYQKVFSCFGKSYLPEIEQGQYYHLEYEFNNFESYHNSIIFKIDSIQLGQFSQDDLILISESNIQISQQSIQSNSLTCSLSDFPKAVKKLEITKNKSHGEINFIFLASTTKGSNQYSLSISSFQLLFQRIQPLCESYDQETFSCSTCHTNAFLDGKANCQCQEGFYQKYDFIKNQASCSQCNIACESCTGPSLWECVKCSQGYLFDGTKCVQCDTGFYFDKDQLKCLACHNLCFQCIGPSEEQCISCALGFYLYLGKCYENCQIANPSTVQNAFSKQCIQSGFNEGELLFNYNQQFTQQNIDLYVKSKTLSVDQTYQCGKNKDLMIGLFLQQASFLIPNLSPHQTLKIYFQLYFTTDCMNCIIQLSSQSGQVIVQTFNTQLRECDDQFLVSFSFIVQNYSLEISDYQFSIAFIENITFAIKNIKVSTIICHPTCNKCSGPLETDCTECPAHSELDPDKGICRCTQDGYGFGIIDQSLCQTQFSCLQCTRCQYPCKTCFASNLYSCQSCSQKYISFLDYCVQQCPSKISLQQIDSQTKQIFCIRCPKPCLECNLNGSCINCLSGYKYLQDKLSCLTDCPTNNYYLDKATNTCLSCHFSCQSCTGPTQYDCVMCVEGMYYDNISKVCNQCNALCSNCIQSTNFDCIQCSQDTVLFQPTPNLKICTIQCDEYPGYFLDQYLDKQTLQIISTCSKCSENCISCFSSQNGCTKCNDGYFLNDNYECDPCDESCFTCFGFKQTNCLSCNYPKVLFNNQCIQNCPMQYYVSQLPNNTQVCINCPKQCITCISKQECLTCAYGFYKQDSQCLICQNNCEICYGQLGLFCSKCRQSYFLQNNICIQKCRIIDNVGYFMDISSRTCKQCDSQCLECANSLPTSCTSCRQGFYLFSGVCYQCPSNTLQCYYDFQQKQILAIQCANSFFFYSSNCRKICPKNFYQDFSLNYCRQCDVACSQCTGPTNQQCQQCNDGYFFNGQDTCLACQLGNGVGMNDCNFCSSSNYCLKCQTLINFNGMCLSQCPPNFYFNTNQLNCQRCVSPCLNCIDQNICTNCVNGFYLSGSQCLQCDVKCLTCSGATDQDCILCNQPFLTQKLIRNECVLKCSQGFYQNGNSCQPCHISCQECIDSSSTCDTCALGNYKHSDNTCQPCGNFCQICKNDNICTQCENGYQLFEGSCLSDCPDRYLNQNGICIPCNINCKNCLNNINQCIDCNDGYYLSNQTCLPCVNNCSACDSKTFCTKCSLGYFLEDNICKIKCEKAGFYSDYSQYLCLPCDSSCASCVSGSFNRCTSCYNGFYLENDPLSQRCLPCNPLCTQCFGPSSSNCSKCRLGVKFDQINSTCISCPSKQYYNSLNGICESCSQKCQECFGPFENNCLSCSQSKFLDTNNDTCEGCFPYCIQCFNSQLCIKCQAGYYLIDNKYCLQKCPPEMRALDDKCLCSETCSKCRYDPINNSSICTKCINDQYLLYQNQAYCLPIEECNDFKDYTTQQCVKVCPQTAKFIDLVNKSCYHSQCSGKLFLFNEKYCVESCPNKFYADDQNICQPCNYKCQKCFGPSDNNCYQCTELYYLHQDINACRDSCIVGYITNEQESLICQQCQQNCKACTSSLVLFEGQCLQKCPQDFPIQVDGQCFYNPQYSVRIYNLQQNQTISLVHDTQIEANLFSNNKPIKIQWDIIKTNDNSFIDNFVSIQSFDLFQLVPYIILSRKFIQQTIFLSFLFYQKASSYYIFQITISLSEEIQIQDTIQLNTPSSIKVGKFLTDKKKGDSQSRFVFSISDWLYDQTLFYDLSFYEIYGVEQNLNLESQDSSSNNKNKIYDFYKDNLFRIHKHVYLDGSVQIPLTFKPILKDISLICELKVYDDQNYDTVYKYVLLEITSFLIPSDKLKTAQHQFNQIKNSDDKSIISNLIYNYSFFMNILIKRDIEKEQQFKNQVNLRSVAYLSGIDTTQLQQCDSKIDCYGNGVCLNNPLFKQVCQCYSGFFGQNCEWGQQEYNLINESMITIINQLSSLENLLIIQIVENISNYFSIFTSNLSLIENSIQSFLKAAQNYFKEHQIDQVDGQILQRSCSFVIQQIQELSINTQELVELNFIISQKLSSMLNIGDKLISYSDASNYISYPYLVKRTNNNTSSSSRRMLQNSEDNQTKLNITLSLSSFTVQFPAEVVESSSKQVIVAQQWKKDPRNAPFAVSQTVSLQIKQDGNEVPVKNTKQPIIINLPKVIPLPVSENTNSIRCSFYDENTNSFKNDGCTLIKETILNIICSCTHLTDFTAQKIQQEKTQNYVDLGLLVKTMIEGQQKLQQQSQKIVLTELPTVNITQRQISLVSQLQIIQSGNINQFLQRNIVFLREDPEYISDNLDILNQDSVIIMKEQDIENFGDNKFEVNEIEAVVYLLIIFIIILHISLRACLQVRTTKLSLLQLQCIREVQKQIDKLLRSEQNKVKGKKKKLDKAKIIKKKFDMSKFKFQVKRKNRERRDKFKDKDEVDDQANHVIRFQERENEIQTQTPPLNSLILESIFSPKILEKNKSNDQEHDLTHQTPFLLNSQQDHKLQNQEEQDSEYFRRDSQPSFFKSQSTFIHDSSKSPFQQPTTLKRSIFSRNQVTYVRFNQTSSQLMLTQDDCSDDNRFFDTKCTEGNLITEGNLNTEGNLIADSNFLIDKRFDSLPDKKFESILDKLNENKNYQDTNTYTQDDLKIQLINLDDTGKLEEEEEQKIQDVEKLKDKQAPKKILLQQKQQKGILANKEIRNQQHKNNYLDLFSQKTPKQTPLAIKNNSNQNYNLFTPNQRDSILEVPDLRAKSSQKGNSSSSEEIEPSQTQESYESESFYKNPLLLQTKKSYRFTTFEIKPEEDYQNIIQNEKQKLINPRYKSMKNYLQTKNLLENIKENNKFMKDANKKKTYFKRQTKIQNLFKLKNEMEDKNIIQEIAYFSQKFDFLKNETLKNSLAFKFVQSVQKKQVLAQSLENLKEMKKFIIIIKNSDIQNPLNEKTTLKRRQLLTYIYGFIAHECQNTDHTQSNQQIDFEQSMIFESSKTKENLEKLKVEIDNFVQNNKKKDQKRVDIQELYQRQDIQLDDPFIKLIRKYSTNKFTNYILDEDYLLDFLKQQINLKVSFIKIIDFALDSQLNITKYDMIQLFSLFRQQQRIFSSQFTKCLLFCTQVIITATINVYLIPFTATQDINLTQVNLTYSNPRVFISLILGYIISYFFLGCLTGIFAKSTKSLQSVNLNQIYISQSIFQLLYLIIALIQIIFSLKFLYQVKDDQYLQTHFQFSYFFTEMIVSIIFSNVLIDGLLYIYYILIAKHKYEDETQSRFLFILACRGYFYFKGFDNIKIYELLLINDSIPEHLQRK